MRPTTGYLRCKDRQALDCMSISSTLTCVSRPRLPESAFAVDSSPSPRYMLYAVCRCPCTRCRRYSPSRMCRPIDDYLLDVTSSQLCTSYPVPRRLKEAPDVTMIHRPSYRSSDVYVYCILYLGTTSLTKFGVCPAQVAG